MEDYNNYNNKLEDEGGEGLEQDRKTRQSLGKNQKIAVAVLGVLAVAVIVVWMVQLKKSINSPFSYNPSQTGQSDYSQENNDETSLRAKDTDGDGLSDWDELNVYETSPYLEDSDSDGVLDKEEIGSGADPNCPTGRDCSALVDTSVGTSTVGENSSETGGQDLNIGGATGESSPTQEEDLQKMLEGQSDASALRKMLLESGMDAKALSEYSDEELMASYQKTLESK